METAYIDPLSPCSRYLEFYFDDQFISSGTGFFIKRDNRIYLISNLHNFTGKDTFTGKHLSKTLAEPNKVRFHIFANGNLNSPKVIVANLIDENGEPLFNRHFTSSYPIDIAVLELRLPSVEVLPLNFQPQEKVKIEIAEEVFIIGYPAGIFNHATPIWKRGTIASEPDIEFNGLPVFLVDASTVRGMSGSPVLIRSQQLHHPKGVIQSSKPFQRIIGIYSGRVPPISGVETNLGYVWRANLIYETIDGKALEKDYWDPSIPNRQGDPPPGWGGWDAQ